MIRTVARRTYLQPATGDLAVIYRLLARPTWQGGVETVSTYQIVVVVAVGPKGDVCVVRTADLQDHDVAAERLTISPLATSGAIDVGAIMGAVGDEGDTFASKGDVANFIRPYWRAAS